MSTITKKNSLENLIQQRENIIKKFGEAYVPAKLNEEIRQLQTVPAYEKLVEQFRKKGYTKGIGQWKSRSVAVGTAGYYIEELNHRNVGIEDVPGNLLREVLLYSASGAS